MCDIFKQIERNYELITIRTFKYLTKMNIVPNQ